MICIKKKDPSVIYFTVVKQDIKKSPGQFDKTVVKFF